MTPEDERQYRQDVDTLMAAICEALARFPGGVTGEVRRYNIMGIAEAWFSSYDYHYLLSLTPGMAVRASDSAFVKAMARDVACGLVLGICGLRRDS